MPIISYLKPLGYSKNKPVLEVTLQCPKCRVSKNFRATLEQLKKVCENYLVHKIGGKIEWVEGVTRLLKCPRCNFSTTVKVAIHKSGATLICNPEVTIRDEWWVEPE